MLGLLGGGLLRGAARGGARGGLLGGLLSRARQSRQGSFGSGGGAAPQQPTPEQQAPQEQEPDTTEVVQQPTGSPAVQAVADAPPVERITAPIQEAEQQRQVAQVSPEDAPEQRTVTQGLLDEAPPAADVRSDSTQDELPPPPTVVNQTDVQTPVARPAEETFPNVPQFALSGLVDTIDDIPPRKRIMQEDPVPMRPVDTKSQARHTANSPTYAPQLAQTATAYAPNYSYRR